MDGIYNMSKHKLLNFVWQPSKMMEGLYDLLKNKRMNFVWQPSNKMEALYDLSISFSVPFSFLTSFTKKFICSF